MKKIYILLILTFIIMSCNPFTNGKYVALDPAGNELGLLTISDKHVPSFKPAGYSGYIKGTRNVEFDGVLDFIIYKTAATNISAKNFEFKGSLKDKQKEVTVDYYENGKLISKATLRKL